MTVRIALLLGVVALGAPAGARSSPPEDEAHRLDRLETKRLNEAFAATMASDKTALHQTAPAVAGRAPTSGEKELQAREERAIAGWRRRREACSAGDSESC